MQCLIQRTFETYTSVSYTFTKLCKKRTRPLFARYTCTCMFI